MMHIAIVEKEAVAKEIVFQLGQVLHDYAWNFTHFTSLVEFVKQEKISSFEVVILHEKFQTQRIYDAIMKHHNYLVMVSSPTFIPMKFPTTYGFYYGDAKKNILYLKELLLPIVKRQEEFCFSYQNVNVMMKIQDIIYIEKQDKYLHYHTKLGEFKRRGNMTDIVQYFKPYGFLHIHVSFLVNEAYIASLRKEEVCLKDNTKLPISRNNYQNVKQYVNQKQGKF